MVVVKFVFWYVLIINNAIKKEHFLSLGEINTHGAEAASAATLNLTTRNKETMFPVIQFRVIDACSSCTRMARGAPSPAPMWGLRR